MCRTATRFFAAALAVHLAIAPAVAATGPIVASAERALQRTVANEPALWRAMLEKLEPGALVQVRLNDGAKMLGTVMTVGESTFTFKPRTRLPVPAREIAFTEVSAIERHNLPMSPGKKTLIGIGVGGGAMMIFIAILAAAWED